MDYDDDIDYKSEDDYESYGEYETVHNDEESENINNQYTVLSQLDLEIAREKEIKEVMDKLYLDRDKSILVLIYYNWNIDKIETNWYDNVEINSIKCGITLSKETEKKLLDEGAEKYSNICSICMSEKDDTFKNLDCGHSFCSDC